MKRNNKHYEYFMAHFQVVNGPGNKLHPETVLTEMIFSQAYLPGKHSSRSYIYFVCLYQWGEIGQRPATFQINSGVFTQFPKRKMSRKMNASRVFVVCSGDMGYIYTLDCILYFPCHFSLCCVSILCYYL